MIGALSSSSQIRNVLMMAKLFGNICHALNITKSYSMIICELRGFALGTGSFSFELEDSSLIQET